MRIYRSHSEVTAHGVTAATGTTLTAAGNDATLIPTGEIRALVTGGPPSGIYASFAGVID